MNALLHARYHLRRFMLEPGKQINTTVPDMVIRYSFGYKVVFVGDYDEYTVFLSELFGSDSPLLKKEITLHDIHDPLTHAFYGAATLIVSPKPSTRREIRNAKR